MNLTLFDLDGTLIETDSDHAFGEFLVRHAWVDSVEFKRPTMPSMLTIWPVAWTCRPMWPLPRGGGATGR